MQKGNIIDLLTYRASRDAMEPAVTESEELKNAIQHLIHRLRELGPLQ